MCALVALADVAQPVVRGWHPRYVAALAGAALYAVLATWAWRGARIPLWIGLVLPAAPAGTILLWGAGLPVAVTPHVGMVGVMALQIVASVAALRALRDDRVVE